MNKILIKICKWLLVAMGFTAYTSCDGIDGTDNGNNDDNSVDIPVEYGTPYYKFMAKCKVVDSETKDEVKGLSLTPMRAYTYTDANGRKVTAYRTLDDAKQSVDGNDVYTVTGKIYLASNSENLYQIKLTDKDPLTDGYYKDSTYVVNMIKSDDSSRDDAWMTGTYSTEVTIEAKQIKK